MSELTAWQEVNDQYLSDALAWLRSRLECLATDQVPPTKCGETHWKGDDPSPPAGAGRVPERLPAMTLLCRRFGLTEFERSVLLLCAAMEFDTRTAFLCAQAQRDPAKTFPTFALAMALFDEPAWDAMSTERPLRYWRLIEINQPGAQPLTSSALRSDERIVNYLKGLNTLDERLVPLLEPLLDSADDLPPSQQMQANAVVTRLRATADSLPVVHLHGADSISKRSVAAHVARSMGLVVYRLPTDLLPTASAELEMLARLYERESCLLPVALYLDTQDSDKELPLLNRFLNRLSSLVFLDTRESRLPPGRDAVSIAVAKPAMREQQEAWQHVLGLKAEEASMMLAGHFNFNLSDILRIGRIARSVTTGAETEVHTAANTGSRSSSHSESDTGVVQDDKQLLLNQVWNACVIASQPRLDTLAQRLEVKTQDWDSLVLPEAEKKLLRQIMDQVSQRHRVYEQWGFNRRMSRGLGINALFAGESGTGKTLAAEVIAHELRLNLYRIDLSQVVSKYIGETEKNLRKLFDAAEDGGTILFFDEADALFGKRSEIKDSHDRYANIEINYLLQRMESYRGLAILATNMKSALDEAFLRRLRFIVSFPFPAFAERRRIWERAFPRETEKTRLDFEHLARFNLTGGSIQNIAVNAAFLAASARCPVTMSLILDAARSEFRKLEKPVNESEFRLTRMAEAIA